MLDSQFGKSNMGPVSSESNDLSFSLNRPVLPHSWILAVSSPSSPIWISECFATTKCVFVWMCDKKLCRPMVASPRGVHCWRRSAKWKFRLLMNFSHVMFVPCFNRSANDLNMCVLNIAINRSTANQRSAGWTSSRHSSHLEMPVSVHLYTSSADSDRVEESMWRKINIHHVAGRRK